MPSCGIHGVTTLPTSRATRGREFENASGAMPHTCVTSIGGAQPWPVDFTFDETVTY
jgi:hypothetical protein